MRAGVFWRLTGRQRPSTAFGLIARQLRTRFEQAFEPAAPTSMTFRRHLSGVRHSPTTAPTRGRSLSDRATMELRDVTEAWDRAMVANDPDAIGLYMTDDWTIVGPDGSMNTKQPFLELVRSGLLTHNVMESHDLDVRVYGDAAVVLARGISGGAYDGQPFHMVERVSSMFIRRGGSWRCVLTHLSRLDQPG